MSALSHVSSHAVLARRAALARDGVWTDGYVPLQRYLGGLDTPLPADVGLRPWALALVTDDALIVHACAEDLCVAPSLANLWQGLGPELARIRKADVEGLHVIPITAGEFRAQRVVTRYLVQWLNAKVKSAVPGFLGRLEMRWYQAVVAIRCTAESGGRDVYFGVPPSSEMIAFINDITRKDVEAFVEAGMPGSWRGAAADLVKAFETVGPGARGRPNRETVEAQEGLGRAVALMNALQQMIDAAPRSNP